MTDAAEIELQLINEGRYNHDQPWRTVESRSQMVKGDFENFNAGIYDNTVDGRNPAPPKKPGNNDLPINTNKQ